MFVIPKFEMSALIGVLNMVGGQLSFLKQFYYFTGLEYQKRMFFNIRNHIQLKYLQLCKSQLLRSIR